MSYTADYPIHETHDRLVYAIVEYAIHGASGDGWNEPREEAHAEILSVRLEQVVTKRTGYSNTWPLTYKTEVIRTDLGEAPQWVLDIIEADTDWLSDLANDDGYDATDDIRDRLHDDREVA